MTDGSDLFTCGCITGYTGDVCDIDIDDCDPNPCQNGNCIDGLNTFACMCTSGYTGGVCDININDCEPDPCLNGGSCIDEVDTFMCICISGFTGDTCDIEGTFSFSRATLPPFPRNCMPQYTAYRLCMCIYPSPGIAEVGEGTCDYLFEIPCQIAQIAYEC